LIKCHSDSAFACI